MTTKEQRAWKEKYERRRKEMEIDYRNMDVDQILEAVSRKFPGCPVELCAACLDNEVLINELRRRMNR